MPSFDHAKSQEILRFGAKALGVSADICERQFIPIYGEFDFTKIEKADKSMQAQLGSMYTGAAILFAEPGAYQSACSVNHGSGRKMARGEAKRKLEHKQLFIDDEMKNVKRRFNGVEVEGIVGNHQHTPLDECGHVYKDLDTVLDVLVTNNIAKVAHRLYPLANLKGVD